ncbi:(Fe-S)-binding protein [Salipaludibacillus sp. CUR1]|uniref:(Fe-S)-binding protein n=1 Tax=Salipaludibacillus sp. CUR1 TaxID=2820003 RepID=UPI001E2BD587|nr:(Fe-S)-binding protein [Salipaludibacillus sp. CUR1]MCE7793181.1 (Fe-S)-binding protein [Salipaludibacillus sp. CUR1]
MKEQALKDLREKIGYDYTFDCVQCGYCLPACPTYETMGKETHSPRGRINLVKMVAEEKMALEDLREPIEKCLGCQACVTACPTNTQYGRILEGAQEVLNDSEKKSVSKKLTEKIVFDTFFPSSKWMAGFGHVMWGYEKTGLQKAVRKSGLTKLAPLNLGKFEEIIPSPAAPKERKARKTYYPAKGKAKATVALFTGCIMDSTFFSTNQNTITLLNHAGANVYIPEAQTCCGALHSHSGDVKQARELAKSNIKAFEEINVDFVVNNAGGCGAQLTEYDHLLSNEAEWRDRARSFVEKSKDISTVLWELGGVSFLEEKEEVVTYQPSCHLTHVQKVTKEPKALIQALSGVVFNEMKDEQKCCGSAGIYNIVHYDDAMEILDVKMSHMKPTKAHTIITTNPGCLLQMKMGIKREGLEDSVRAVHLVDFLSERLPLT